MERQQTSQPGLTLASKIVLPKRPFLTRADCLGSCAYEYWRTVNGTTTRYPTGPTNQGFLFGSNSYNPAERYTR